MSDRHYLTPEEEVLQRMVQLGDAPSKKVSKIVTTDVDMPRDAGTVANHRVPFFVTYITREILDNADGAYDAFGKTERRGR